MYALCLPTVRGTHGPAAMRLAVDSGIFTMSRLFNGGLVLPATRAHALAGKVRLRPERQGRSRAAAGGTPTHSPGQYSCLGSQEDGSGAWRSVFLHSMHLQQHLPQAMLTLQHSAGLIAIRILLCLEAGRAVGLAQRLLLVIVVKAAGPHLTCLDAMQGW